MRHSNDKGYLQVYDKVSGDMLLEITTTLGAIEDFTQYNFEKCTYAFIEQDYYYELDNEQIMELNPMQIDMEEE